MVKHQRKVSKRPLLGRAEKCCGQTSSFSFIDPILGHLGNSWWRNQLQESWCKCHPKINFSAIHLLGFCWGLPIYPSKIHRLFVVQYPSGRAVNFVGHVFFSPWTAGPVLQSRFLATFFCKHGNGKPMSRPQPPVQSPCSIAMFDFTVAILCSRLSLSVTGWPAPQCGLQRCREIVIPAECEQRWNEDDKTIIVLGTNRTSKTWTFTESKKTKKSSRPVENKTKISKQALWNHHPIHWKTGLFALGWSSASGVLRGRTGFGRRPESQSVVNGSFEVWSFIMSLDEQNMVTCGHDGV